jgi:hypothetical protein
VWSSRLASSMVTVTWGRTPPVCGSRPPASWRRASSVSASALRWAALRSSSAVLGRARGSSAVRRVSPASGPAGRQWRPWPRDRAHPACRAHGLTLAPRSAKLGTAALRPRGGRAAGQGSPWRR